jgi:hypothetical protein
MVAFAVEMENTEAHACKQRSSTGDVNLVEDRGFDPG